MKNKINLKRCPMCGSHSLEYKLADHVSKLRGTAHKVPQTVCLECNEIFFGPESLKIIRSNAGHLV
jgi:hypothetical protein